jgi:hypothetical protein
MPVSGEPLLCETVAWASVRERHLGVGRPTSLDARRSSTHDRSMRWAIAASLVLLAGLAAGGSPRASVAVVSGCRISQFSVEFGPLISEATGQHTITLRLINRGRRACVLDGFPRVQAHDGTGVIPFAISHSGDQMVTSRRPRRWVVRPRGSAFVAVNHYRCDRGGLRTATTLRIGDGRATRPAMGVIKMSDRYQRLDYCGRADPGSILVVSPFEPTFRATLKH